MGVGPGLGVGGGGQGGDSFPPVAEGEGGVVGGGGVVVGGGSHQPLPVIAARFLHWVGFDVGYGTESPPSEVALPPPNDDTTHALAFLAYDFFGRIVEKAIFLRNLERQKRSCPDMDEASVLLELESGEQLEQVDVARAMDDPDIKPLPLYSADETRKVGPQLYFGPGFEDRLEIEMEEMLRSYKADHRASLDEEELGVRRREDRLFARLAQISPTAIGSGTVGSAKAPIPPSRNDATEKRPYKRRRTSTGDDVATT